eukprot:FR739046.1.p1 GENE.FR739046.1~~FR739046.1.p1  ORF type:complete len:223 (+),score=58.67 FR739046.1:454-1122(+)
MDLHLDIQYKLPIEVQREVNIRKREKKREERVLEMLRGGKPLSDSNIGDPVMSHLDQKREVNIMKRDKAHQAKMRRLSLDLKVRYKAADADGAGSSKPACKGSLQLDHRFQTSDEYRELQRAREFREHQWLDGVRWAQRSEALASQESHAIARLSLAWNFVKKKKKKKKKAAPGDGQPRAQNQGESLISEAGPPPRGEPPVFLFPFKGGLNCPPLWGKPGVL